MLVISSTQQVPAEARGAAIALGNFDGVHLGHRAVIDAARRFAKAHAAPLATAVFEPHPRRLFQPDAPPFRLQSAGQRVRALGQAGVDIVYEIGFDRALASMSDEDFSAHILAGRFGAACVVVGEQFHYGRARQGDVERLKAQGLANGFAVESVAHSLDHSGAKVSSTAIRAAIKEGRMSDAARHLGRPFAIEGEVLKGFQRGRTIGVPTANLALGDYVYPRFGVYAVRVASGDGQWRDGAASVGVNPTFDALSAPVLEAHIFNFDRDLYGKSIEVALIAYLRPELKFDGVEALKAQMQKDFAAARAVLSAAP